MCSSDLGEIRTLHVMEEAITNTVTNVDSKSPAGFAEKLHAAIKSRSTK